MDHTRAELVEKLGELLSDYADVIGEGCELPVLGEWVVVAITDDAGAEEGAGLWFGHPPNQWRHRSIGLLTVALDDSRDIVRSDD